MVNWRFPAYFGAFGALVSLIAGLAGGNPFGVILLRLLLCAVLSGGVGIAVEFLLRRFLPELGSSAGRQEAPAVDIVIDDRMDLVAPGAKPSVRGPELGGEEPEAAEPLEAAEALSAAEVLPAGESPMDLPPDMPVIAEPLESPAEARAPGSAEPLEAAAPLEEADDLKVLEAPEGEEGFGELERLPALDSFAPSTSTRRGLQAEKLEAQVDSLVKGQDPASLAKAVRSFLKKD